MLKGLFIIILLNSFFLAAGYAESINDLLSERNFKMGLLRLNNRQYDASIQLFNKALSFQPLNYRARYYLGYSYLNAGYSKNTIDEWENLIKIGGANFQVKQKINDLYFRLSIDKSYDYTSPYILSKMYDGNIQGMHKIDRPSFIVYDEKSDSLFVSSAKTRYIVEIDGNGKVMQQIGRKIGDDSEFKMPTGIFLYSDKIYPFFYPFLYNPHIR